MSRPGPNTFPLNTSKPQGRPPLSPFLKPGLASLETEHPPVLSEIWWVWRFRREGSAVPWGLAKSLMLPVTLPGSIKRNTRQGRIRWLQAVHSLLGVATCTSRVCEVRTEDSPSSSKSKPWKPFPITMQMRCHTPQTSQATSVDSLIHLFSHLSYSSFLITLPQ